jgi:hypothetical protein
MSRKSTARSPFEDYTVTVIIGDGNWEWGGGKGLTRAVVELSQDCCDLMPGLSRTIPGAGYRDMGESIGFHYHDLSVVLEGRHVTIVGAEDEATAMTLMDWLKERSTAHER